MKAIVLLSILACALGLPQVPLPTSSPQAVGEPAGNPSGSLSSGSVNRQGSGGPGAQQHNWGPKAYGPGLNNHFAFPPNPFVMQRAIALTEQVPNTLVRVGLDGEVQITDRHGFEVDIGDWFGYDFTEGIEEFEDGPFGFGGFGNSGPSFRGNFGGNFAGHFGGFDVSDIYEEFEEGPFGFGGFGNFGPNIGPNFRGNFEDNFGGNFGGNSGGNFGGSGF